MRKLAEQQRLINQIVQDSLTPQEKYNQELARLNEIRDRLSPEQYAQAESKLAATRDKAIAALQKQNELKAKAAQLAQSLGQATAAVLTPQEKYNKAIRELNALKPYLTADQYAAALGREKAALQQANEEERKRLALKQQIASVRQSIKTDDQRKQEELDKLKTLRKSATNPGGLTTDEYQKAVAKVTQQYQKLNQVTGQHSELLDKIAGAISGQKGAWEDLGKTAIKMLLEIATKALFAKQQVAGGPGGGGLTGIIGSVLGIAGGGFGGGGGGLGSIVSSIAGTGSGGGGFGGAGFFGSLAGSLAGSLLGGRRNNPGPAPIPAYGGGAGFAGGGFAGGGGYSPGPVRVVIQNYGPPAEANVSDSTDSNGMRQIEIKMFEVGKRATVSALQDGSADVPMANRFGLTPRPGGG